MLPGRCLLWRISLNESHTTSTGLGRGKWSLPSHPFRFFDSVFHAFRNHQRATGVCLAVAQQLERANNTLLQVLAERHGYLHWCAPVLPGHRALLESSDSALTDIFPP